MEEEVWQTITPLLYWIAYTLSAAYIEANFYHYRNHNKLSVVNEHHLYVLQRGIVLFLCFSGKWQLMVAAAFMFPFWHDGMYYACRNYYDNTLYTKRFWDHSNGPGTSWWTKYNTVWFRIVLLLISIVIIIKVGS
jgi:hypothetical protein